MKCFKCDKPLTNDEIAIYKRLVDRGATKCLCKSCFAKSFDISESVIDERIFYLKKSGCMLFGGKTDE